MPAPVIQLEHHERATAEQLEALMHLAWVPRAMKREPERKVFLSTLATDPSTYTFAYRLPFGLFEVRRYKFPLKYNFLSIMGRFALPRSTADAKKAMVALRRFARGGDLVDRTLEFLKATDNERYLDLTRSEEERFGAPPDESEALGEPRQVGHLLVIK